MTLVNAGDDQRRDIHAQSVADTVDRIELKLDRLSASILLSESNAEHELFEIRIGSHWVAFTQNSVGYVSSGGVDCGWYHADMW